MNNKRINLDIIDQVWQTSAEACPIWCIHDCGGSGGCRGGSCTHGNEMPCCCKYACEWNLLVIRIRCSIIRKQIVHDHTYLQRLLLLSHCRVLLLFSLPVVLIHLHVVLFVFPPPLLHLLGGNILLCATTVGTTTWTPGRRSSPITLESSRLSCWTSCTFKVQKM
jgi:hypothetical protein